MPSVTAWSATTCPELGNGWMHSFRETARYRGPAGATRMKHKYVSPEGQTFRSLSAAIRFLSMPKVCLPLRGRNTADGPRGQRNARPKPRTTKVVGREKVPRETELRAPKEATPITLRMQAQTAAQFEDVLAHVTLTGADGKGSRQVPLWDQTRIWDQGDLATPEAGGCLRAPPPNKTTAAGVPGRRWGSVVFGWRAPRPPRVVFVLRFASLIHSLISGKSSLPIKLTAANTSRPPPNARSAASPHLPCLVASNSPSARSGRTPPCCPSSAHP